MLKIGHKYNVSAYPDVGSWKHHTVVTHEILAAVSYRRRLKVAGQLFFVYRVRTTPYFIYEPVESEKTPKSPTQPLPKKRRPRATGGGLLNGIGSAFGWFKKLLPRTIEDGL